MAHDDSWYDDWVSGESQRHYAVPRYRQLPDHMARPYVLVDPDDESDSDAFLAIHMIRDPSEYPFILEMTRINAPELPQSAEAWGSSNIPVHMRHVGLTNITFTDGHVEGGDIARIKELEATSHDFVFTYEMEIHPF